SDLRVHLVHPVDERPLLFVQPHRLTTQVARSVDEVALNELTDLGPECRPILVAVVRDHQDGHHFTTRRMARGSPAGGCCCASSAARCGRFRSASSPLAISQCRRARSTGDRPKRASCSRISCNSSLRSFGLSTLW